MQSLPNRVLVVRLGAIGDVVNALVFAEAIKAAAPDTHIAWAVHGLAAPLLRGHPAVDRVHLWSRGGGVAGFRALLSEIRAANYDLAVDLQRLAKSALLARLSGARRVLGFDRARAKEASAWLTREHLAPGDPGAHMVEQYLEFARHLGLADPVPRRRLPLDTEAERWAAAQAGSPGALPIAISLGATKPANRWAPERFGALAAALAADGHPVLFTGGPADAGAAGVALEAAGGVSGVTSLVGATSLLQLSSLLARARLFIGCDSGPMHIAAAHETPVIALFGPADPRRTGPFGEGHRVLSVLPPCAPCNRKACNQPRHACMEDLTLEHVLEAVREQLGSSCGER